MSDREDRKKCVGLNVGGNLRNCRAKALKLPEKALGLEGVGC